MTSRDNRKTLGACVPVEIYDAVNARAKRDGMTANAFLKAIIASALMDA